MGSPTFLAAVATVTFVTLFETSDGRTSDRDRTSNEFLPLRLVSCRSWSEDVITEEPLIYPIYEWRRTSAGWEKVRIEHEGDDPSIMFSADEPSNSEDAGVSPKSRFRHLTPILATIAIAMLSQIGLRQR